MIEVIKQYWPHMALVLFLLAGHVPIRAALKPTKYSRADKILAAWEALSLDARKLAKSQDKRIHWLEPVVLVIDAVYPVPEEITGHDEVRPPPPESTTKPITIEAPPEPPRAA